MPPERNPLWKYWGPKGFRLASRLFVALYGRFPLLGELRSAAGIVREGENYIMVERSDGRGRCFPGGMAFWGESEESSLRREVREETGLQVLQCQYLWTYHNRHYLPSSVAVYQVETTGAVRGSWEGAVVRVPAGELEHNLFPIHAPILEYLRAQGMAPARAVRK
jgi:ADP-ribose pyrophosphatase YjhB (NUDIX family)